MTGMNIQKAPAAISTAIKGTDGTGAGQSY